MADTRYVVWIGRLEEAHMPEVDLEEVRVGSACGLCMHGRLGLEEAYARTLATKYTRLASGRARLDVGTGGLEDVCTRALMNEHCSHARCCGLGGMQQGVVAKRYACPRCLTLGVCKRVGMVVACVGGWRRRLGEKELCVGERMKVVGVLWV
ncbi:unnamed protein product [Dovyalis caffra]|uniref:Uncharacterized protein n=1 Tax=Dovyalis caffra TaxID=77055 RepID=A0AAV1QUM9_9ROSI|nr:unnamed protein product [Dovyalis caffra]